MEYTHQELMTFFNAMDEVFFSVDRVNLRLIQISQSCEQLWGYKPAEFLKHDALWFELVHPEDQHIIEHEDRVLEQGKQVNNQYRIVRKDKTIRWVEKKLIPTLDETGKLIRIDGIIWDITDHKTAALEREKIIADLIQHNKDLEQFTYIISHNLRAPIANILGLADMLKADDLKLTEKLEAFAMVATSVKNLDVVISDLNHILQVRAPMNERKEAVSFTRLVKDIKTSILNTAVPGNATFQCSFDEVDTIYTIRSYLYSIFYNLISNSIKFRKPDVAACISVKSYQLADKTELRFKDNGKGIDLHKNNASLFGLYKRFDTSTEGKGMGLFMVKTQVEALGGTISINSKPGEGTEFIIRFAAADD